MALVIGAHFLPFALDFPYLVAHTYSSKTLGLKQEDPKFEANLDYIMRFLSDTKPNKRRPQAFPSDISKGLGGLF